jgi:hypothetical protein
LFRSFNRRFSYVILDQFIFQDADYLQVAVKEVEEITAIFASYDLVIREMQPVVIQKPSQDEAAGNHDVTPSAITDAYNPEKERSRSTSKRSNKL